MDPVLKGYKVETLCKTCMLVDRNNVPLRDIIDQKKDEGISTIKLISWVFRKFGVRLNQPNLDHHVVLELTRAEASAGGEKQITYRRGQQTKNLMVKVPAGVKTSTKIRLRGMGMVSGRKAGDLYLHVRIIS